MTQPRAVAGQRTGVQRSSKMIKAIRFQNYKVLRDTSLPLGPFTLLIGPNGSGKSTAISAPGKVANLTPRDSSRVIASADAPEGQDVTITVHWGEPYDGAVLTARWTRTGPV